MNKIDIRDLRVNNLVYSSFSKSTCKVTEIRLDESGYGVCKVTGVDGYKDVASLSPIPFTKEILEKNFKWSQYRMFWYCEEDFRFVIEESGDLWYFMFDDLDNLNHLSFHFQFVHQLQNLLRDLGIEKEIII